jgi:hypothetical protein
MAKINTKIKLYALANDVASVDFQNDVKLQDNSDGNGAFIAKWNLDIAEPTAEQIASYETAGNAAEALSGVLNTRRKEYGSYELQMEMIYKDQKNGTTTFKDHCDKVRSDNPKD